ncbi:hypothetical protein SAMN05421640_0181 [Ekhidna lutea]|uniref:Uncharacterized protein n=1 Tax=Ekhidna lutea TaxID=447679 RepID=A0A239EJ91_EKHLU|nr:hypothetical protein [Ekhidna lutea]SNS44716.1 hypothetical protein SAMN05421640_0181 [Ekhidna lutea]
MVFKTLAKPLQYILEGILKERDYIAQCKKQIEQKLNLSSEPMERDFEYLHEVILEKTRTDLSTSTLRRIWSDKHQSIPQAKTLEALAQFLDHSGWHAFKASLSKTDRSWYRQRNRTILYIMGLLLVVSSIILLTSTDEVIGDVILEPEVDVHEGVPATIGFHYQVKSPNIDIELSWNPYERTRLDMEGNFYSGTYYYPDYHKAKLLYGEQVLIQKPVHVTTVQWHGLIMDEGYDANPVVLDEAEYLLEDKLAITKQTLQRIEFKSDQAYPVFTLSHADLSRLSGDDFSMVAQLKSEAFENDQTCLIYEVLIKGTHGSIRVPISKTGCYGLGVLKCAEKVLSGKLNDLSALSTDLSIPHEIAFRNHSKQLTIYVADNDPLMIQYENSIGTLKVIKFIFQGSAELLSFELRNENEQPLSSSALRPF